MAESSSPFTLASICVFLPSYSLDLTFCHISLELAYALAFIMCIHVWACASIFYVSYTPLVAWFVWVSRPSNFKIEAGPFNPDSDNAGTNELTRKIASEPQSLVLSGLGKQSVLCSASLVCNCSCTSSHARPYTNSSNACGYSNPIDSVWAKHYKFTTSSGTR